MSNAWLEENLFALVVASPSGRMWSRMVSYASLGDTFVLSDAAIELVYSSSPNALL